MKRKIEIFTMGASVSAKVDCKSCPKSCDSRDQVELTPEVLFNQLLALHGEAVEVIVHDYTEGNQEAILKRQNDLFKENGVSRIVNKMLINPLAPRIWPSVIIDGKIKSEGVLIDATRISQLMAIEDKG